MLKLVSLILLVSLLSLSSAKIGLRDPDFWKPLPLMDLLNEQMDTKPFGSGSLELDSFLSELAQATADSEEDPIKFMNEYKYPSDRNVLVWKSKRKGASTLETILLKDYNDVMEHMPGNLHFRYKNNKMNIRVRELKELMDVTNCDVNMVPLKCNTDAKNKHWENATGEFIFSNKNYKYNVKFNNMLKVYKTMLQKDAFRYDLDIFKNTYSVMNYKNENYELNYEVPNFYGDGFWPNKKNIWGTLDRESLFKTMAGDVYVESHIHHNYLDCDLYVNEVFDDDVSPYNYESMTEDQVLEISEKKFKTMSEMFDRETIFKSFDKYGFGVALDKDGNIDLVFALSSPINNNAKTPEKPLSKLFNGANNWPYIGVPVANKENFNSEKQTNWWGQVSSQNPLSKEDTVKLWIKANQLTMDELNKMRSKDGLKSLVEHQALNKFAQAAADKMAQDGKFTEPSIPKSSNDIIVVAMLLKGETKLNEYLFQINENNFGQLTCFDNFSNQKYPVREITEIDNYRYSCSINSGRTRAVENWKKYDSFGTGVAYNNRGDTYHIFTLTSAKSRTEL
jgi:hypothetical protein